MTTKERPIIFSGPMVNAILEGRKTQTRRVVKPQPLNIVPFIGADNLPTWEFGVCLSHHGVISKHVRCPYGQPGDRLWVRETFRCNGWATDVATIFYKASERKSYTEMCEQFPVDGKKRMPVDVRWKSPIHMPRWASRITLEITAVRVERLQDISRSDAKAEGFTPGLNGLESWNGKYYGNSQLAFQACWKSINGPGSWAANPWVWVIEFERLEP